MEPPQAAPPVGPIGIGGWLILMAIGQVLGPLRALAAMAMTYINKEVLFAFGEIPVSMYGGLVIDLVFVMFLIVTSTVFFARKRIFKIMFTIEAISLLAINPLEYLWMSATSTLTFGELVNPDDVGNGLAGFIIGLIWVVYLWRSKRVANTFVN